MMFISKTELDLAIRIQAISILAELAREPKTDPNAIAVCCTNHDPLNPRVDIRRSKDVRSYDHVYGTVEITTVPDLLNKIVQILQSLGIQYYNKTATPREWGFRVKKEEDKL